MPAAIHDGLMSALEDYLSGRPEVVFAYLFGSRARGQAGPLSDTDVAVYLDGSVDRFDARLALIEGVMRVLGDDRVDVVTLNDASPVLRHAVIAEGVLLKESRRMRIAFEERATAEYLDTSHLREVHGAALRQRLQRHPT